MRLSLVSRGETVAPILPETGTTLLTSDSVIIKKPSENHPNAKLKKLNKMTEKMENNDSWDEMIFRFIKEKKDWLSKHILRNRLEHQAKNAQKQVKVKDTTDSKIWENLYPGNQVITQNPPPFEV